MNREDAAKLWPIIKAFGEKEKIQYRGHDSAPWQDIGDDWSWISLSGNLWQFRVKPSPRTIAIVYSERSERIIQHGTVVMPGEKVITVELPE